MKKQNRKGKVHFSTTEPIKQEITSFSVFKPKLFHCVFLFALGFLLYINTLNHGFVLDDSLFFTGNTFTQKGLGGIKDIWTNDAFVGAHGKQFDLTGGRYRPLAITVFALMVEFFGSQAFPGHLTNILLYGLTGVLLYLFLCQLLKNYNEWIPLITSTLFIIHPIHTEVVANIKSLDEILALIFLILSLMCLFKQHFRWTIPGMLFYFLSLLSKESTITALAIIPIAHICFRNSSIKNALLGTLPYFIAACGYLALRTSVVGTFGDKIATNVMDNPYLHATLADKYATIISVCGKYLWMTLFPHPLSFDYSYNAIPVINWANWKATLSLITYAGMGVIGILKLKKEPIIAFGILFYLASFSIVSNVFFNIGAPMGERFAYLPSLGICIAIAGIISKLLKIDIESTFKINLKWTLPLILLVPIASYATLKRNAAWKNNFSLYSIDINTVPNSARVQLFLGIEMLNKHYKTKSPKELQSSITHLKKATEINPNFYHAYYNLGLAYQANKDHTNAVSAFERVLKIQPTHINSHYYLGLSYGQGFNQLDQAIAFIEKGLKYGYNGKDGYVNLGVSYAMKGNYSKAIAAFEKALEVDPNNASLLMNMGITYDQLGKKELAKAHYDRAFAINPSLKKNQ